MFWVPYAYDDSLDGCWDTFPDGYLLTSVEPATLASWGVDDDTTVGVLLCCDDYGFVHGELLNRLEMLSTTAEMEHNEQAESEENDEDDENDECS